MNKISMVVTDLDGTLLTEKKEVTEKTRKAIHALKEHGILFGIASGRPVESTLLLSKDWGIEQDISFLIGMNGGTIYDCNTEQKEEYCLMAGETILEIIEHFKDMNVLLQGQDDQNGNTHAQAVHDGSGDGHGGAHTENLNQNGVVGNQAFL